MREILFLGDVFLPKAFQTNLGGFGAYCVNFEAPITQSNSGIPGKINLKVKCNYLKETFGKEPLAVCLANNHIMDYGVKGFLDTIADLKQREVPWFGVGKNKHNVNNPLIINHKGIDCAFLGYVCPSCSPSFATESIPGVTAPNEKFIANDIIRAKEAGAKRVIVSLHWGAEGVSLPRRQDIELGRCIIDRGADLIIGHHAHCIQSWEIYNGKPIFYGLGNCIFPEMEVPQFYEKGMPGSMRKLKQFKWNKRSLAVAYDPASGATSVRPLYFDGKELRQKGKPRAPMLSSNKLSNYHWRYHNAFLYGKYKMAISNFLSSPRILRPKDILNLISLTRTTRYK